jgi:hypothetical protein
MNPPRSADEILTAAMAIADPGARSLYLDGACVGEPGLRQEVESLLAAAECAGTFLESPLTEAVQTLQGAHTATGGVLTEQAGSRIGRYRLLEQIGEGGFGVVWMAEQDEPVRRRVALKIIRPGMDTREVVARFEAERQALALMDHPHSARIRLWDTATSLPCGRPIPASALFMFTRFHLSPDGRCLCLPTLKVVPDAGRHPSPLLQVWSLPGTEVALTEMQRRTESATGMRLDPAGNLVAADRIESDTL